MPPAPTAERRGKDGLHNPRSASTATKWAAFTIICMLTLSFRPHRDVVGHVGNVAILTLVARGLPFTAVSKRTTARGKDLDTCPCRSSATTNHPVYPDPAIIGCNS